MRCFVIGLCLVGPPAFAQEILQPKPDAVLSSPVTISIRCGAPCADGRTHMHLIIDQPAPSRGEAIPFDKQHIHVHQRAQTMRIDLPPGQHRIFVALGDGDHVAESPDAVAGPLTFTVK